MYRLSGPELGKLRHKRFATKLLRILILKYDQWTRP